jgi:hypothetical protein
MIYGFPWSIPTMETTTKKRCWRGNDTKSCYFHGILARLNPTLIGPRCNRR